MKSHYQTLGLPSHASKHEIRQKFRELAKQYHPDHHPDNPAAEEQFKKIAAAYAILMNKPGHSAVQESVPTGTSASVWVLWAFSPVHFWAKAWSNYMSMATSR